MKQSPQTLKQLKDKQRIPMLTAYTAPVAKALEQARIPVILVGDSVGMVEMGFDSTREVTIDHMEYHVAAVRRGAPATHVIADLPYLTDSEPQQALKNAQRLIQAGADSVKLEGPKTQIIAHLAGNNIPVVGHTGLTPQTAQNFKRVGSTASDADRIMQEATTIQAAGAFMLVIEHVPSDLAEKITQMLQIPTIGIGAGAGCDGQVLVINDLIGLGDYWPPFSRQYAHISEAVVKAAGEYAAEVRSGIFPEYTH